MIIMFYWLVELLFPMDAVEICWQFYCVIGTQGFPPVADQYAQRQVPSLHPSERLQDDSGTTPRTESEPA